MKKVLLVAAVMVMAVCGVQAQGKWYVGTTGIGATSGHPLFTGVMFQGDNTAVGIAPEVGYNFSDNLAFGLGIGFASWGNETSSFGINPYVRWSFWKKDNFAFYLQGDIQYTTFKMGPAKTNTFGIAVLPGVSYSFNEHFSMNCSVGSLGYAKTKDMDGSFGLLVDGGLNFSLSYTF